MGAQGGAARVSASVARLRRRAANAESRARPATRASEGGRDAGRRLRSARVSMCACATVMQAEDVLSWGLRASDPSVLCQPVVPSFVLLQVSSQFRPAFPETNAFAKQVKR